MSPVYAFIMVAICSALISSGATFFLTDASWQTKWDKAEVARKEAIEKLTNEYRAKETALRDKIDEVAEDGEEKLRIAKAAADRADAKSVELHNRIAELSAAAKNPVTAIERAAAATNAVVLADVLRRADIRAGDLAKIADDARERGLTCEKAYQGLVSSG